MKHESRFSETQAALMPYVRRAVASWQTMQVVFVSTQSHHVSQPRRQVRLGSYNQCAAWQN